MRSWPESLTLAELQAMSEAVIGVPLDKVTFRRRVDASGIAQAIDGQTKMAGAHRPDQLYVLTTVLMAQIFLNQTLCCLARISITRRWSAFASCLKDSISEGESMVAIRK